MAAVTAARATAATSVSTTPSRGRHLATSACADAATPTAAAGTAGTAAGPCAGPSVFCGTTAGASPQCADRRDAAGSRALAAGRCGIRRPAETVCALSNSWSSRVRAAIGWLPCIIERHGRCESVWYTGRSRLGDCPRGACERATGLTGCAACQPLGCSGAAPRRAGSAGFRRCERRCIWAQHTGIHAAQRYQDSAG